jgi:hypothetical protein
MVLENKSINHPTNSVCFQIHNLRRKFKMKKRLLVLLMALAMCFAMFGCGSEEEAPAEDGATEEPAVEEPAAPEEDPAETEADPAEEAPADGEEADA